MNLKEILELGAKYEKAVKAYSETNSDTTVDAFAKAEGNYFDAKNEFEASAFYMLKFIEKQRELLEDINAWGLAKPYGSIGAKIQQDLWDRLNEILNNGESNGEQIRKNT